VRLFSLQKGPPAAELGQVPDAPVTDLAPMLRDFADTAPAVAALDLVIMADSGVAHLAGALGTPVWVLVNFGAYWLWHEGRDDSPWYDSLRLFRAGAWGEWAGLFDTASVASTAAARGTIPQRSLPGLINAESSGTLEHPHARNIGHAMVRVPKRDIADPMADRGGSEP
jgi:hypothetical protein